MFCYLYFFSINESNETNDSIVIYIYVHSVHKPQQQQQQHVDKGRVFEGGGSSRSTLIIAVCLQSTNCWRDFEDVGTMARRDFADSVSMVVEEKEEEKV